MSTQMELNGVTEVFISDATRTTDNSRTWRTIRITTEEGTVLELSLWSNNYGLPLTIGED